MRQGALALVMKSSSVHQFLFFSAPRMIQYVWVGKIRNKAEPRSNKEELLLVPDRLVKTNIILTSVGKA
jgi:hypothetical protein